VYFSKVSIRGIGAALKLLLTEDHHILINALNRDEIVALFNTVHKMSEALKTITKLTELYSETLLVCQYD
jgi:hypothetical protein